MTIEPLYTTESAKDTKGATTTTKQTISEHHLTTIHQPPRKKETAKAWVLTLILHFLIAASLVGYWYFNQRPQTNPNIAVDLSTTTSAQSATQPASSVATLSSVVTLSSTPASTTMANTNNVKPLANYVAQQQLNQPAQPMNLPSNGMIAVPITTFEQKVVTYDAPIKKALTARDMPKNEHNSLSSDSADSSSIDTPRNQMAKSATNVSPEDTKAKTATNKEASKNLVTAKETAPESEASDLSKDIDVDTDKLSQLIDEVKETNQKKIDAQIQPAKTVVIETPSKEKETEAKKPASSP